MTMRRVVGLLQVSLLWFVAEAHAHTRAHAHDAVITPAPTPTLELLRLKKRDILTETVRTCGYQDGDLMAAVVPAAGYNCAFDNTNSLWGFCPVNGSTSGCQLVAQCWDESLCSGGCGLGGVSGVETTTCSGASSRCWSAILTQNPSQTYHYMACDSTSKTIQNYLAQATTNSTASSRPQSSGSSKPSLGVIIGAVIGGVALIIAIVVALVLIGKRKRSRSSTTSSARPIVDIRDIRRAEGFRVVRPETQDMSASMFEQPSSSSFKYEVPSREGPTELEQGKWIPGTWNSGSTWTDDHSWGGSRYEIPMVYHEPVELRGIAEMPG